MRALLSSLSALAVAVGFAGPAAAQEQVVNLYTSRHYQTDDALYDNFTKATGIKVNRIEGKEDGLIERLRNEGANSPADVFMTVDAGRLWQAESAGLLQPTRSETLEKRIPAHLRHPEGKWFGFSTRARAIFVDKDKIKPGEIARYEDLADPKWKGKVCIRSSTNIYNLSLMGALINHLGEAKAQDWAKGVVANFGRAPAGGDTDQLKAAAAGECAIALSNHYYYVRLMKSSKPEEKAVADKLAVVWPNQADRGVHVNVSGAGVAAHAPHKAAAVKFLEYLASDQAQGYFANGNNEFPAVPIETENEALRQIAGKGFKIDPLNVSVYGENQPLAQVIYDRAGWR
jgi:iron(III) transport system substrate-binding protein